MSRSNRYKSNHQTERIHFKNSRLLDYLSRKELTTQIGHQASEWPLVVLKELLDNALDACEEAGIAPEVKILVNEDGITISDNGPGIPPDVIDNVLDFSIRVSSREAYVAPDRGAQGNAWKTIVPMPFVLFGSGRIIIKARGIRHDIQISVDQIQQSPKIDHKKTNAPKSDGTSVFIAFPNDESGWLNSDHVTEVFEDDDPISEENECFGANKARFILPATKRQFLQLAFYFCWLNPHLTLSVHWRDNAYTVNRSNPKWEKWRPSNPSDSHWYTVENLQRLVAAHIGHGHKKSVREFVTEFKGLKSTRKVKQTLDACGLSRAKLTDLVKGDDFDTAKLELLLHAMKEQTRPVKPKDIGVVGEEHFRICCERIGGDPNSFKYKKVFGRNDEGIPYVIETVFCFVPDWDKNNIKRRLITGCNWSPGIVNLFRQLGRFGQSLDSVLGDAHVSGDDPVVFLLHIACPKVAYADRGKSTVIVEE